MVLLINQFEGVHVEEQVVVLLVKQVEGVHIQYRLWCCLTIKLRRVMYRSKVVLLLDNQVEEVHVGEQSVVSSRNVQ